MHSHRRVLTLLRAVLLLQTFGLAASLLWGQFEAESDIYGLLMFDFDWEEAAAQTCEDVGMLGALCAAVFIVGCDWWERSDRGQRPLATHWLLNAQFALLGWLSSWQLLYAIAKTYRGGFFMPAWTLGEQAARYVLPLCIAVILWQRSARPRELHFIGPAAEGLLRWGAAITFFAHGLKAWFSNPEYVNFILATADNLLGWAPREASAVTGLAVIGAVDFIVSGWLVLRRSQGIAWYMFAWGLITAVSRMTSYGWEFYPETIMRGANWGLPLALALLWSTKSAPPKAKSGDDHLP